MAPCSLVQGFVRRRGREAELDLAALRFETVDPTSPSARNAIERYFAELDERFASGFDPGDGGFSISFKADLLSSFRKKQQKRRAAHRREIGWR